MSAITNLMGFGFRRQNTTEHINTSNEITKPRIFFVFTFAIKIQLIFTLDFFFFQKLLFIIGMFLKILKDYFLVRDFSIDREGILKNFNRESTRNSAKENKEF
ncbi:hypothetical protein FACS1894102_3510 [Spirochaetia bacterium]|nr:hypothetical protein FACS1894102_3510 [Spirochaetia bacterium]